MESHVSKIDSKRFGIKISKINVFDTNIESQLIELKKLGVKLIISRIDSNNIELINKLEDFKFRIKDTQLTFYHNLMNIDQLIIYFKERNDVIVEQAQISDKTLVGEIAFNAFKGYGHYAADNNLDIEKSNYIYKDWAQKSCIDKGIADHMFVAKVNGQIAGFLSLKVVNEKGKVYGIQHLGAIDKKFQNYNIFRLLILHCLKTGLENKHDWQQTFLLSTNIPVTRSYLKMGFTISESNHTMHCWL